MTPDHRRRLQLSGDAIARELLAWKAEVGDQLAGRELLDAGEARASAALRAVLGIAREPSAMAWRVELEIVEVARDGRGPALRAHLVVDLTAEQLNDAALAEIRAEIAAGFQRESTPAYELATGARR